MDRLWDRAVHLSWSPYRDYASRHVGRWYGSSISRWLYCETCGLEGSHKEDKPRGWHERHFRRMHKIAVERGYRGRHRAPDSEKPGVLPSQIDTLVDTTG